MKPNVDIVNLIATQELPPPPGVITVNSLINIWPEDSLRGYKYTINELAQIISTQLGSGSILPDRVYVIDVDMPSGSSISVDRRQIIDPYLDGKVYSVHRRGVEWFIKGSEWDNTVPSGGIQLLQSSGTGEFDTFRASEVVIISFTPQFSPYIPTPDAIARFTVGEQLITTTSSITAGMFRKLIVLQGATDVLTVTLPSASAYPENVILAIISNGGNHKQATLRCDGADVINYNNTTWPDFYIGQNDQIELIRTSNGWHVVQWSGSDRFGRIGTIDNAYLLGKNQFACTSLVAQSRAVYPGVWAFIQRLQAQTPSAVVSGAAWESDNNNKGLFSTGDGSTTFHFPYLPGRFVRYTDPTKVIDKDRASALQGSLQNPAVGKHKHNVPIPPDKTSQAQDGQGRICGGGYLNEPTALNSLITDDNNGGNDETRPYNVALIPAMNY